MNIKPCLETNHPRGKRRAGGLLVLGSFFCRRAGGFGAEELFEGGEIQFGVHGIAEPVACAGDDDQLLFGSASLIVDAAHCAGDENVAVAVEEDHRHGAVFQGLLRGGLFQIEVPEQFGAQPHKGVAQGGGKPHFADDGFDDIPRAVIAAVCQNADDIFRERAACRHHNGGGAHRDAC